MNKKGISLVALLITIIATLILVSITVIQFNSSKDKAKLVAFASDLQKIQEQVKLYYLNNGAFPTLDSNKEAMNEQQLISMVDSNNTSKIEWELSANSDDNDDKTKGQFYQIDLAKIDVTATLAGTKTTADDVYVIAYPSMNVYYLKGVKVSNDVYFSITSKLTEKAKIHNATVSDVTSSTNTNLMISKKINDWTNSEPINIKANISGSQIITIKFAGIDGSKKVKNILNGMNDITFNLSDLFKSNKDIKGNDVLETALTQDEINAFKALPNDQKVITVSINDGVNDVETKNINVSNFDDIAPNMDNNNLDKQTDKNVITVVASDSISGIKQIRYDFVEKNSPNGTVPYYSQDLTGSYIEQYGKNATLQENGSYLIELPTNITKVFICVQDKAGNWKEYNNIAIE